MKKATYNTILTLIANIDTPEAEEVRAELNAELAKGKEKADANRALYAEYREQVLEALQGETPKTAADVAKETGIAMGKVVYGLTHYWVDDVVVDKSGKQNVYLAK